MTPVMPPHHFLVDLRKNLNALIKAVLHETLALEKHQFAEAEEWLAIKIAYVDKVEAILRQPHIKKNKLPHDVMDALAHLATLSSQQAQLLESMQKLNLRLVQSIQKRFTKNTTYAPYTRGRPAHANPHITTGEPVPLWINRKL